jgi:hypothetical protein
VGNGHEPVQCRSADDGVEGEVNFRNFELHVLSAEVVLRPESNRQGDGPYRVHGIRARSGEWARRSQLGLRDLQVLERCIADDAVACSSVNQHMVGRTLAMVGAVTSGSTAAPAMFSGQSDGPKEMVVFFHRWWGATFGVPGFTESTSRRRVLMSRRETSSELPLYMTYSFLWRSSTPDSESDWWKRPLRSLLGV